MKKTATLIIKARDLSIGFFGWFLFGNLVLLLNYFLFQGTETMAFLTATVIALSTLIATLAIFAKKRIWIGTGIVAAVIINFGLWIGIMGEYGHNWNWMYIIWYFIPFTLIYFG